MNSKYASTSTNKTCLPVIQLINQSRWISMSVSETYFELFPWQSTTYSSAGSVRQPLPFPPHTLHGAITHAKEIILLWAILTCVHNSWHALPAAIFMGIHFLSVVRFHAADEASRKPPSDAVSYWGPGTDWRIPPFEGRENVRCKKNAYS